jgi:hypothetical protein
MYCCCGCTSSWFHESKVRAFLLLMRFFLNGALGTIFLNNVFIDWILWSEVDFDFKLYHNHFNIYKATQEYLGLGHKALTIWINFYINFKRNKNRNLFIYLFFSFVFKPFFKKINYNESFIFIFLFFIYVTIIQNAFCWSCMHIGKTIQDTFSMLMWCL